MRVLLIAGAKCLNHGSIFVEPGVLCRQYEYQTCAGDITLQLFTCAERRHGNLPKLRKRHYDQSELLASLSTWLVNDVIFHVVHANRGY